MRTGWCRRGWWRAALASCGCSVTIHSLMLSPSAGVAVADTGVLTPMTVPLAGVMVPSVGGARVDWVGAGGGTPGVVPIVIGPVAVTVPPALVALMARS